MLEVTFPVNNSPSPIHQTRASDWEGILDMECKIIYSSLYILVYTYSTTYLLVKYQSQCTFQLEIFKSNLGVVNVVNGTGIDLLEPLCSSKIPRLLTTIGSTQMGRRMVEYSHSSIKRHSSKLIPVYFTYVPWVFNHNLLRMDYI